MTMRERIARAMAETVCMSAVPAARVRWVDAMATSYLKFADAMLAEMREPTGKMLAAEIARNPHVPILSATRDARMAWQVMIDAAREGK